MIKEQRLQKLKKRLSKVGYDKKLTLGSLMEDCEPILRKLTKNNIGYCKASGAFFEDRFSGKGESIIEALGELYIDSVK